MRTINKEQTTNAVFEAIDDDKFLIIGEKCQLEHLSKEDDGIFPNAASWRGFINGNFVEHGYFLDNPKPSTVKRWCYPEADYKARFCVKVGPDLFVTVAPENVKLSFDYELFYSRHDNMPSSVELYVTGAIV